MMDSSLTLVTKERHMFSIDWILSLDQNKPKGCLKLHRPWTGLGAENKNRGDSVCSEQPQSHHHQHQAEQTTSARPTSSWYIGRRPRTAYTHGQINALETVFQVNCYPGIQLREQLASRLDLDEDRIQIWFQNRRAKLRRSLRETRLQFVQSSVADLRVSTEVSGYKQDNRVTSAHQLQEEQRGGCK